MVRNFALLMKNLNSIRIDIMKQDKKKKKLMVNILTCVLIVIFLLTSIFFELGRFSIDLPIQYMRVFDTDEATVRESNNTNDEITVVFRFNNILGLFLGVASVIECVMVFIEDKRCKKFKYLLCALRTLIPFLLICWKIELCFQQSNILEVYFPTYMLFGLCICTINLHVKSERICLGEKEGNQP